jgi:hypothetical protein|tara:strand:- start:6020 stop:6283 length:264 start_codon:yes stop_codon:yes gene_type:complete
MGLSSRKKSGKKIGGSSLIVVGQPIYSTKTFSPDFNKKRKPYQEFAEAQLITPTTTTTTTLPVLTCNIETQNFENVLTQDYFNLVWC